MIVKMRVINLYKFFEQFTEKNFKRNNFPIDKVQNSKTYDQHKEVFKFFLRISCFFDILQQDKLKGKAQ